MAARLTLKEATTVHQALPTPTAGDLSIVFADDAQVTALNRQFRGKDKPTNVLSFPDGADGYLGDVILAYETVRREARMQGKTLRAHTLHLVVHGVLHLLGYDHKTTRDARRMEAIESAVLAQLDISNPYVMG